MQLQICNGLICCLETFVPILSYWSGLKCEVVEICCKNLKLLQENSCLCPFSLHCSSNFQQCSSCNTLLVFLKFCWLCIPTYNELANSGLNLSGLKFKLIDPPEIIDHYHNPLLHSGQKCFVWVACLWSKMPMLQRVGMRKGGEPLPVAFQYLIFMIWRPCDLNLVQPPTHPYMQM